MTSILALWPIVKKFWPAALVAVCVVALLIAALRIQSIETQRDTALRTVAEQAGTISAMQIDAGAKEQASIERVIDNEKNTATEKETSDAIRSAADPRLALSCLRLKRAGAATPAACR